MKKLLTLMAMGALVAGPLAACERNEGPLEETGESIDQGVDDAGDQLQEGTQEGTQE